MSSVQSIQSFPSYMPNPELHAQHPGNWPLDAMRAVEYQVYDRKFPTVSHETETKYFSSEEALEVWIQEQQEWVTSTGNDFSVTYSIYDWNFGPKFRYSSCI